jgi:predicted Zn-dependent peptidase
MNGEFVTHKLDNGLRVVIEVMSGVKSAACGFLARTGSRDEDTALAGVSHFLEHMCFKGTHNRTCEQLNIAFDEMGALYNAFTSKERTFYYGWVRQGDIYRQMELLADMMRSAIPPHEFDTEKNVVLEEIAMSSDQINHLAFDFLHEQVFGGSSAAWPVLGYTESVEGLTRDQMYAYFQERYAPDNLVLIVAGRVSPDEVITEAARLTADWQPSGARRQRTPPRIATGAAVKQVDRFSQQDVALVFPAPSARHRLKETAQAAASILGGSNSRIFWNVVQTGLSARAGAWHLEYDDFGIMILSGLCDPDKCEALVEALRKEAAEISATGPKPEEVERVKSKRITALAVEAEAPYYRLVQLMDDVDSFGEPRSLEQRLAEVDAVTPETVSELFREFPVTGEGYLTSVGPRLWPPAQGDAVSF